MTRCRGQETLGDPGDDLNRFRKEVLLSAGFVYQTSYGSHGPKRGLDGVLTVPSGLFQAIAESLWARPLLELIEQKGIPAHSLYRFDHVIHEHELRPSGARVPLGMAALGGTESERFQMFVREFIQS